VKNALVAFVLSQSAISVVYLSLLFGADLSASLFKSMLRFLVNDYWLTGHWTMLVPHVFVVMSQRAFRIDYASDCRFCDWREHWRCGRGMKACSTTWALSSMQLIISDIIISTWTFFILGLIIDFNFLIKPFNLYLKPLNIYILRFYLRLARS